MLVPVPQPYDFALSTVRFREYGSDGTTVWHEGGLQRVVAGREIRIEPTRDGVRIEPGSFEAAKEVSFLLGLPFELDAFRAWAVREPALSRVVGALAGFRPTLTPNLFEALVIAITAQQVSLQAAAAIRSRFVERYGVRHELASEFPARERVARGTVSELRSLGFSERKAEYVIGLARSDLDLAALTLLPDDEVKAQLTALRGLGEWTADWFLARYLGRPRAWPAGDLALRKAVRALYGDVDVRAAGARFEPFQNLTAHYLLAQFLTP